MWNVSLRWWWRCIRRIILSTNMVIGPRIGNVTSWAGLSFVDYHHPSTIDVAVQPDFIVASWQRMSNLIEINHDLSLSLSTSLPISLFSLPNKLNACLIWSKMTSIGVHNLIKLRARNWSDEFIGCPTKALNTWALRWQFPFGTFLHNPLKLALFHLDLWHSSQVASRLQLWLIYDWPRRK